MKTKLILSVCFIIMIAGFKLINPSPNGVLSGNAAQPVYPNNNIWDKFILGSMSEEWDYQWNYTHSDQLELNVSHIYNYIDSIAWNGGYRLTPIGRTNNDKLLTPINNYKTEVTGYLKDIYDNHNGRRSITMRPKIAWLCYGQSSIYEAEPIDPGNDLWFYSFNENTGTPVRDNEYGDGHDVLNCSISQLGPNGRYILKRLKANTEQSNSGDNYYEDKRCDWFIKPRVRVDRDFVLNPNNWEIPIFKIKVIGQSGNNVLKEVDIKAKYFLNEQFQYDGRYLEEYNFGQDPHDLKITGNWGDKYIYKARGTCQNDDGLENKSDIQVYWYANCDMWIDYVKVENDVADELLKGDHDDWIKDEVEQIAFAGDPGGVPPMLKFYIELTEFNNLPCAAYVNQKLKEYSDSCSGGSYSVDLMADFTNLNMVHVPWDKRNTISSPGWVYTNYVQKVGLTQFFAESYPLTSLYTNPSQTWSKIPETLPVTSGWGILANPTTTAAYDLWLQDNMDHSPYVLETGEAGADIPFSYRPDNCNEYTLYQDEGNYRWIMNLGNEISKIGNIPFIFMPQDHLWYTKGEVRREPTNEELDLMANVSVSYGARGLMWFYFHSEVETSNPCTRYARGILDVNNNFRTENVYRQGHQYQQPYKWEVIRDISQRMKAWEPYIMNFNNDDRHSYIYRIESERNAMYQNTYFSDVFTYKYGTGHYPCAEDFPQGDIPPQNTIGECKNERYLQVATFEKPGEQNTNYFMMVNRRCSPHFEPGEDPRYPDGEYSGYRRIKINLNPNSTQISGFDNWNIIDVENPLAAAIPYHRGEPYVDLGWFEPGQGKLYKMVPTSIKGGILAGDENITGESFTCEAPVYNNGFNITIGANTTIHFNDSSRFVMNGGVFTVGDQNTSAPQNITSDAVPGGSWRGHSFTNCEVKIYGATFSGLANDTTYAVNIIDCPVVDIRNCTFNTNSSLKGGVNAICFNNPFIAINNIYIGSNTFNSSGSTIPTVNVSSYAGVTTPLIIENNTFNEGNTAVFLSGVIGGAIKGNTITDNYIGINALTSSIDVVQNTITSTVIGSMGLFAAGGSELKLNSSGAFTLGGLNNISNEGTGTNNINVDGSYFLLDDGENIFNISSDQSSYHLYGYFPMFTAVTTEETNNCFKVNSSPVDPPINMVTSGYQGTQITFNFTPYLSGCEIIGGGDGLAIDLGDGIYDTIYAGGSGSGGSQSSVASVRRTDSKIPLSRGVTAEGSRGVFIITSAKTKYDSISVLMRYRNYSQAKTKCLDLINTYPDSIQSIFAVSKLFLATVASDTSYNAANTLKIFYENLILNHSNNTSLVKRANYYILKCKVRMREYSQALAGFQQIINQNPYSYEGLIARWDYMATSLLVQGQGGAFSSIDNEQLTMNNYDIDGNDDDKKPFTKEQRQDIRKSINTAIEISKNDDETKIKKLEEKSELGDVNASKELTQMKSLKQVVKTEKPKSITQHVRIVSEDIRKVFGSNTSSKGNEPKNIPLVFRISQNYPNPFNPVTKINYDLPKDSKVKIVIYDILGREVKRLVNNELKTAGSYIVDFNASNYASGVYFYRIEAEEPNGNKFVDSKKMVLLK